jgi:hypothetical protein
MARARTRGECGVATAGRRVSAPYQQPRERGSTVVHQCGLVELPADLGQHRKLLPMPTSSDISSSPVQRRLYYNASRANGISFWPSTRNSYIAARSKLGAAADATHVVQRHVLHRHPVGSARRVSIASPRDPRQPPTLAGGCFGIRAFLVDPSAGSTAVSRTRRRKRTTPVDAQDYGPPAG